MKPSVIVIDDDLDVRETLSEYLRLRSIDVLATGNNGKDAVQLYEKHQPDVVLMDLMMPEYDGFYGLENIRKIDSNANVAIVSGCLDSDSQERLVEMNASAFIEKPFVSNNIVEIINKLSLDDSAKSILVSQFDVNDHTRLCNLSRYVCCMLKMKIMIINDSRAMRLFLEDIIKSYADCEIIGSYFDGNTALNSLEFKKPDVIMLDLEMPIMDGLTFLERLPDNEKIHTIIISDYVKNNSKLVNDAMVLGAVDSVAPPSSNVTEEFKKFRNILHHKLTKISLKSNRFFLNYS